MNLKNSNRKNSGRSEVTRDQLMRAAERLFAINGLENVSVRAIIAEAGQKNESALQYHFGNRDGLVSALQDQRNSQVSAKRAELLGEMHRSHHQLTLREVCTLMVKPAFLLCRADNSFRDFLGVFGQLLLSSSRSVVSTLEKREVEVMREMKDMLQSRVTHLDEELFETRFENTARFAILSMSRRAREKGSFRGKGADFFISNLVDTMAAMMAAKPSRETSAAR